MIHYHGGPITPESAALRVWRARHAFVSFAHPQQIRTAAGIAQTFALDNGAFSIWKSRREVAWRDYYAWVWEWRRHPGFDFAVVPDVIGGTEKQNDALASEWPFARHESAVVWHTNESVERLVRLSREWPRVAIGSSEEHDVSRPKKFLEFARDILRNVIWSDGYPVCKLHGLRMLNTCIFKHLPLASADSTNVACNAKIDKAWKGTYAPATVETRAQVIAERIESFNGVGRLEV